MEGDLLIVLVKLFFAIIYWVTHDWRKLVLLLTSIALTVIVFLMLLIEGQSGCSAGFSGILCHVGLLPMIVTAIWFVYDLARGLLDGVQNGRNLRTLVQQIQTGTHADVLNALTELRQIGQLNGKNGLLSSANLAHTNFQSADLRGANLKSADLREANLQESRLSSANLNGARLEGANLQKADLRRADLRDASLQNAHLHGACFGGASLQAANLSGALLRGVNVYEAHFDEFTILPDGRKWTCEDDLMRYGASLEPLKIDDKVYYSDYKSVFIAND